MFRRVNSYYRELVPRRRELERMMLLNDVIDDDDDELPVRSYNFDALTCESCKAFFRRVRLTKFRIHYELLFSLTLTFSPHPRVLATGLQTSKCSMWDSL